MAQPGYSKHTPQKHDLLRNEKKAKKMGALRVLCLVFLIHYTFLPATKAALRSMAEILHNLAEHVYPKGGEMAYTIQRVLKEGKKYEYKKYDYKKRPLEKPHDVLDKMKNDAEMKKKQAQAKRVSVFEDH